MKIRYQRCAAPLFLIAVLLTGSGCQAPMAMGAFESISSASPTAFHHLSKGKVESYWVARFGDVVEGSEAAARSLALTPADKKIEKDRATLRFGDDRGDSVALSIERRTANVTSILIDVGFTGSMAFAKLVARQIVVELIEAGVFPDDAEPDTEEGQGFKNL